MHRRTATEDDEDEDNSDGWIMLNDSEDRRCNHMRVAHPSLHCTVASESIAAPAAVVVVLSIVVVSW